MLDRQFNLFRVDTNAFLHPEEQEEYNKLVEIAKERTEHDGSIKKSERNINKIQKKIEQGIALTANEQKTFELHNRLHQQKKEWKTYILQHAAEMVAYNETAPTKRIRQLNEDYLKRTDAEGNVRVNLRSVVGMFESTLSRSFGIRTNELTYDIFILEIYFYDIAKDLIINGFDYNGKHYVYFSSSAGQIRTKKAVFVEEQKFKTIQNKLTCGLDINQINEQGGMCVNKYLSYTALTNSATDLWEDVLGQPFDIDRCIVVDDFETMVKCVVDHIDDQTYKITPGIKEEIPIPHTDGCGMVLPQVSKKNFMIRAAWFKGLLGVFDFRKFIEVNNCSPIVKDVWGTEYDVFKDDIQVIFTKSQFKLYKYYKDWQHYKDNFKKYGCEVGICNIEEDKIPNAKINYQMLQTLYDATDDEIAELCKVPNKNIKNISKSLKNMLAFFGVDFEWDNPRGDYYNKALKIYPELLNDPGAKQDLYARKASLVKKYRGGHLDVSGKFTFVLPDLYAFCEWLFGKIDKPKGLLENQEVFCRLYKNSEELDCLRSPHLYIEHCVRKNVCNKKYRNQFLEEWFTTDAIYTSTHDSISKVLQFDDH